MLTPSNGPATAEWESLVGKAMVRFGDIELVVTKCLTIIPRDEMGKTAARLEFGRRSDLLIEILTGKEDRGEHLEQIMVLVKRAKRLADTRNLIAHNPVMLDMYVRSENEQEVDVDSEWTIRSARNDDHVITIEELREFVAEVEDVAAELWGAFLRHTGTADHLWKVHRPEE